METIISRTHARAAARKNKKHRNFRFPIIFLIILSIILTAVLGYTIYLKAADDSPWDPVSQKEIDYALEHNNTLTVQKNVLLESGLGLVGKVNYFWGGKSKVVGWDDKWGELTEVTSEGSASYGTMRPFGLDCSGFVTWCFIQTGYDWEQAIHLVGNGTGNQFRLSNEITWEELEAGDLVFQNTADHPDGNHVGICIGRDRKGAPLFVHCAAGENNVVVTHADGIFRYARRPSVYEQ